MNNQWFSKVAVWLVIGLVLFTVFKQFDTHGVSGASTLGYSDFLEEVRGKQIKSAVIQEGQGGTEIVAVRTDDTRIRTIATYLDRGLVGDLINNGVKFEVKAREEGSLLMTLLVSWGPMLLLIGVWVYFMRQMQGGGKGGPFSFGKSKARMMDENNNQVTFADVAGCDEAKEEVKEVVDFLKDPTKFQKLGGRIPRGLLLVGPPGTGKTLLAKSIAGEAKVPFFSISGSDFVEMFVGVGASRVRDMFDNAKKNAPCIIFIDEIDAVIQRHMHRADALRLIDLVKSCTERRSAKSEDGDIEAGIAELAVFHGAILPKIGLMCRRGFAQPIGCLLFWNGRT